MTTYGAVVDVFDDLLENAEPTVLDGIIRGTLSRKLEDMGATPDHDSLAWQRFDEAHENEAGELVELHGRRYRMVGHR